ncbi:DUF3489 domain-containing protein [Loktanella sp. DJP18]|uniref:DUF3489 domain-containing protein n=1 Tax=Loktanella sp. DJP18 TaxID=3409788 RepID=UPI003BB6EEDF
MTQSEQLTADNGPDLAKSAQPARGPKPATKKTQLIKLLRRTAGADIATIGDRLGWQPHTVRASLSGLRKAGHHVEKMIPGPGKAIRYRILSGEAAAAEGADSHGG